MPIKKSIVSKDMKLMGYAKKAPVGVKIISVVHYILSVVYVALGLLLIVFSNKLATSIIVASGLDYSSIGTASSVLIFFAIVIMILGIVGFFIARGLWILKNWARIVAIIFAILGVITQTYSAVTKFGYTTIIILLIDLLIAIYLLFSKEVKEAFKR